VTAAVATAAALDRLADLLDADDLLSLEDVDVLDEDARDLSLKCVSRCCFMLSARVNFLEQFGNEQGTAFSAVWILECREAWPEVVKVFSQPWLSRYRHGYRLPDRSAAAGLVASSSYDSDRLSLKEGLEFFRSG